MICFPLHRERKTRTEIQSSFFDVIENLCLRRGLFLHKDPFILQKIYEGAFVYVTFHR